MAQAQTYKMVWKKKLFFQNYWKKYINEGTLPRALRVTHLNRYFNHVKCLFSMLKNFFKFHNMPPRANRKALIGLVWLWNFIEIK